MLDKLDEAVVLDGIKETGLKLDRPLLFIDLETTGLDIRTDRIIEISMFQITPDGKENTYTKRLDPQIPISEGATLTHGITNEMLKDCPTFEQVGREIMDWVNGCDIAGFNSNAFDLPLLYNEFNRVGLVWNYSTVNMIDVGNIFKRMNPRTLVAAVNHYLHREHEGAHGAEQDVKATAEVLMEMLRVHIELPTDAKSLALYTNYDKPIMDLSGKFTTNEEGTIILNFGKYKGEPAADHMDFVSWMLYKADFAPDTREICEQLMMNDNPFK